MKKCAHCKETLPVEMYGRLKASSDGLSYYCKPCTNARQVKYRAGSSPEAKERRIAYMRDWRFRKHYGLSIADVERLKQEQHNRCAICDGDGVFIVDHDHTTGRVRGLLCLNCNSMLGYARDLTSVLKSGIEYLEKSQAEA